MLQNKEARTILFKTQISDVSHHVTIFVTIGDFNFAVRYRVNLKCNLCAIQLESASLCFVPVIRHYVELPPPLLSSLFYRAREDGGGGRAGVDGGTQAIGRGGGKEGNPL